MAKSSKKPQGEVVISATLEDHQRQVALTSRQDEVHVSSAHEHAQQQQAAAQLQRQVLRKKAARLAVAKKSPASRQKAAKSKPQLWRSKKSAGKSLSSGLTDEQAASILCKMTRSRKMTGPQQGVSQQLQLGSQHASQHGFFMLQRAANAQNDSVGLSGDGADSPPSNGA